MANKVSDSSRELHVGQVLYQELSNGEIATYTISDVAKKYFYLREDIYTKPVPIVTLRWPGARHILPFQLYLSEEAIASERQHRLDVNEFERLQDRAKQLIACNGMDKIGLVGMREIIAVINKNIYNLQFPVLLY